MAGEAPLYVQIFNELSLRLAAGQYPVERRLPTESELCDEFGASRFTVREALRRLVAHGMVQRRQGAGSIVISVRPQTRYIHEMSSLDDLSQFALDTHYELLTLKQVTIDAAVAEEIGGELGSRWWMMEGLRRNEPGGGVLCFVRSYMPQRVSRYVRHLAYCVGPFYAHLAKRVREEVLEVDQVLHGGLMDKTIARHLRQKPGNVSLCALRRYVTKQGTLIASYNWHVAQNFHYRIKLSRNF